MKLYVTAKQSVTDKGTELFNTRQSYVLTETGTKGQPGYTAHVKNNRGHVMDFTEVEFDELFNRHEVDSTTRTGYGAEDRFPYPEVN